MGQDIFERIRHSSGGALGQYRQRAEGYFVFPKLEGQIGPYIYFGGERVLCWSINNYLGLANHPEVRKIDSEAAARWGAAYPMGSRLMTGNTALHEELERRLALFEQKEAAFLFNFGYQGIFSAIDSLLTRYDVVVYDAECHACLLDGIRLHIGSRYKFRHNDIEDCRRVLALACSEADRRGGGVLLITEGVFGMTGALGALDRIVELKRSYNFRILVDDAHGFGVMGAHGRGTTEHFGVMDDVDIYIGTYAKAMATIGGFIAAERSVIDYLKYNMRSQIYAKSLPLPVVEGALKRLEIIDSCEGDALRAQLWSVTRALQRGFCDIGFDIGPAEACVTPVHIKAGVNQATNIAVALRTEYRIFCSVVIYPVIPKGMVIFRIIPTAEHTLADVEYTLQAFVDIKCRLDSGEFDREMPNMAIVE